MITDVALSKWNAAKAVYPALRHRYVLDEECCCVTITCLLRRKQVLHAACHREVVSEFAPESGMWVQFEVVGVGWKLMAFYRVVGSSTNSERYQ